MRGMVWREEKTIQSFNSAFRFEMFVVSFFSGFRVFLFFLVSVFVSDYSGFRAFRLLRGVEMSVTDISGPFEEDSVNFLPEGADALMQ